MQGIRDNWELHAQPCDWASSTVIDDIFQNRNSTIRAPDDPDTISQPAPDLANLQQQHPEIWANNVIPLQKRIAARLKNTRPKEPVRPASIMEIYYYHTDHLGTPRELTDTEGHIVWEARYQAWGRAHQIDYPAIPHTLADGNTLRQVWIEPQPHEPHTEPAFSGAIP